MCYFPHRHISYKLNFYHNGEIEKMNEIRAAGLEKKGDIKTKKKHSVLSFFHHSSACLNLFGNCGETSSFTSFSSLRRVAKSKLRGIAVSVS